MRSRRYAALAGTSAILVTLTGLAPAQAADQVPGSAELLLTVLDVAPEVLADDTLGTNAPRDSEVRVDASKATADLTLGDVTVGLPVGEGAVAEDLPTGDAAIVGEQTTFAAVEKTDGSVQVVFTANDASSPTEYAFEIEPVKGARFEFLGDGAVWYVAADGSLIVGAAAPWAKDANGNEVATHFEVHGNTLVQVVDHRGAGVAYPVVADPFLGIDLFSRVWNDTYNGQLRVNLTKSAWGQANHLPTAAGIETFLSAGWSEAKAKSGRLDEKATLRQQYECHVWGGYANLAGDWNLEKFRPTRTTTWSWGVARHRCNWTTANDL